MIKVLIIEPAGNLWGSERALLDLLGGLKDLDVAICCPPNTALQSQLYERRTRIFPYFICDLHKKSKLQRVKAAVGVLRACLQWRPDVIYLNQAGVYGTVYPVAQVLRLPIVAHVRIFEDVHYLARHARGTTRLRGLIAISHAVDSEIAKEPLLARIPRHCIYDGYKRAEISSEIATKRAHNSIACVGRIVPIKGQDIVIGAMNLLGSEGLVFECLMVGDGDAKYLANLKRASPPSVQWLGFVEDVVSLLRNTTLLVCPSRLEPLGRVIFEAWDAGAVPIVCAKSGGAAEVLMASAGGILYEQPTPESLAAGLCRCLSLDIRTRQQMIENGRAWLKENCDPLSYGKAVSEVLCKAVIGHEVT